MGVGLLLSANTPDWTAERDQGIAGADGKSIGQQALPSIVILYSNCLQSLNVMFG